MPSIAPGLFIAAAGFLLLSFAQGPIAYQLFTQISVKLTKVSQILYGAGFLVVGVGLVILAVMHAREHTR